MFFMLKAVTDNFLFKDNTVFKVNLKQVTLGELKGRLVQRAMSQDGFRHNISGD